MNAMELLSGRRSASKLGSPAPEGEVLDRVLSAALRAPDHGALRPWKILLVRGEGLDALGRLFGEALQRTKADATPEEIADAAGKAKRSPLLVIVACTVKDSPKIPEVEQLLSAGTVMHGLLLGFQAEGFGAVWKTGKNAYDPFVKGRLGLAAKDHVLGFLHVGTVTTEPAAAPRPSVADHVVDWRG